MNKVILMGRLTKDPEVKRITGDNTMVIANYSTAVNRVPQKNGQEETDFFNCTCFGKLAEFAEKYLKKGTKIIVVGRIQNDNYTNKDGQKVYGVKIMVEEQEFAESKGAGANSNIANHSPGNGFIPASNDEELPFN